MNARVCTGLITAACCILMGTRSVAFEPSGNSGRDDADQAMTYPSSAADRVRRIIEDEAMLDRLDSLHLRMKSRWTTPPHKIEKRRAELEKEYKDEPDVEISADLFPGLRGEITEDLEIAFDSSRLRKHSDWHDYRAETRIFDGTRLLECENYLNTVQQRYIINAPHQPFDNLFTDLSWLRMGPHNYWWNKSEQSPELLDNIYGRLQDFHTIGEQEYRGRRCYVIENRPATLRLFVGMDDGRLHGHIKLMRPSPEDPLEHSRQMYQRDFASMEEVDNWYHELSDEERVGVDKRAMNIRFENSCPWTEYYLDDYREINPGLWFPAQQGYVLYDVEDLKDGSPVVQFRRELELVEAIVNKPLPDSLFEMKITDGFKVIDFTYDPPLEYQQKKNRTPEEWQTILDEHEKEQDRGNKLRTLRAALVGKPAFEFPQTDWLNSEPLNWKQLRGRVVVLHFWACWCGPCHNDLPALNHEHKESDESGITIIGVHSPGSDLAEIESEVKKHQLGYPIVVDAQQPHGPATWGQLNQSYGGNHLPYSVAVDQDGRIAACGLTAEVWEKARELASETADHQPNE